MGHSMCILWLVVQSLGAQVSGLLTLLLPPQGCKLPQLLQSLPQLLHREPELSPMVGCKHLALYLSGSGRASQEIAISGFHQQVLSCIHNSIRI